MPPYVSPLRIVEPSLPPRCEPAHEFLFLISSTFKTCIPTNLALLSTLLGTCSIISWLFAQLPQIYKNHKLKSTSGLSVFFLAEWLLGDATNLLGCLFTGQASWQIIIATYYVFVDCCLCSQWVWYEMLHHGRPLRPIFGRWNGPSSGNRGNGISKKPGTAPKTPKTVIEAANAPKTPPDMKDAPNSPQQNVHQPSPTSPFRIPNFARSSDDSWQNSPSGTSQSPQVRRVIASSSPMPSPRTVLYISLVLAVLSHTSMATPIDSSRSNPQTSNGDFMTVTSQPSEIAGKVFSWSSTFLYLGSRLPQLYKNQVRKSTAGLSPTLFAAAFFGNLFYSTSLLSNPCAWYDFAPGSGAGWVGPEGSDRNDWVLRAAPFFLGAAGVLIMDAAVGLQFVYFGDNEPPRGRSRQYPGDDEIIITVNDHGKPVRRRLHWHRVSGWMRGWAPAVSVAATPNVSRASTPVGESSRSLSGSPNSDDGASSSTVSSSKSIPIKSNGSALDEARALLGTSRHASPRHSYGAFYGSPRSPAG